MLAGDAQQPAVTALADLLACPRCRGVLTLSERACACAGCGARFPVEGGVARLADRALHDDPLLRAEWQAQHHARALYLDPRSLMNRWEAGILPRLCDLVAGVAGPILDVGCGVGHFGRAFAARTGRRDLVGVDLQAELLVEAEAGYLGRIEADVHRLPLRDRVFAAAIAANTLHHVGDGPKALSEIARCLAPGGLLVAYDPRACAPLDALRRRLRRGDHAFTADHRAFSLAEYRALCAGAGLTVERLVALDTLGPLVASGLDLVRAGHLGVPLRLVDLLVAIDRQLARVPGLGLMVLAVARKL